MANTIENHAQFDGLPKGSKMTGTSIPSLRLIQTQTAKNPNLRLQQGLFSVFLEPTTIDDNTPVNREDMIQRVFNEHTEIVESGKSYFGSVPVFYRLRGRIEDAPEILWMLRNIGVSAGTIFEGYDGVVSGIAEKASLSALDRK